MADTPHPSSREQAPTADCQSALLRRFDEALRRSDRKLVVIVGDPERRLLLRFVAHLLGQDAGFFGSLAPMIWFIEVRGNGHGANSTSLRVLS